MIGCNFIRNLHLFGRLAHCDTALRLMTRHGHAIRQITCRRLPHRLAEQGDKAAGVCIAQVQGYGLHALAQDEQVSDVAYF